ncbi:MAG TPA: c-type cytochrome, partial [Planctomycetaceae bacterium]|nr:c-type cytochrome [Planctomycetaceae bacterium]
QTGPALRVRILDTLLTREHWTVKLLDHLESGSVAAAELDAARQQRLLSHTSGIIRERAEKLLAGAVDSDRQKVLDAFQPALKDPGDASRGKSVFTKACATCHRFDGTGHEVGPDLAALTDKSPQALLVSILDPNRAVESKYVNYVAVTHEGRQHSGLLAAETGNSITLVGPENKRVELLRRDLEELASTSKSTMPEGLEKDLSPQDVADVIAYMRTSGTARQPKAFPGNKPAKVTAAADGSLELLPRDAELYGSTLVLEAKYGNLGDWGSADDEAVWTIEVARDGRHRVDVEWACDDGTAGNPIIFECAGERVTKAVRGTGTWDDYARETFGTMTLARGPQRFRVQAGAGLNGSLIDLKAVRLVPIDRKKFARKR